MKVILLLALLFACQTVLDAEFETWTNQEGKVAELELIKVQGEGDALEGVFNRKNGNSITLKANSFSASDAERIKAFASALNESSTEVANKPTIFDSVLDKNLVLLENRKLETYELKQKPTDFYVFYFTASWCPPCQAFTPDLVRFYKKHKNPKFEIVLISSDKNEVDMEEYAKDKKMPWPQLKFSEVKNFESQFPLGVSGIPAVVVCDLNGKIISQKERDLDVLQDLLK